MRKQILTAIGVLLLGSTAAFASPQSLRSNFNDQRGNRTQQEQLVNRRNAPPAQYVQYQPASRQTTYRQNEVRYSKNQRKHHHKKAQRFDVRDSRQGRR